MNPAMLDKLSPAKRALMEAMLREKGLAAPAAAGIPLHGDGPAPLSFAQQRLWFVERLNPGMATYNLPLSLRITGALDADALSRAWGQVLVRHRVLRSVMELRDGEPVQVVKFDALPPLVAEEVAPDALVDIVRQMSETVFDLGSGPLVRARLLRVSADDHAFLAVMHHAVGDGWSIGVILRELAALYNAFVRGEPSPLAPLPVQYADFAAWQRRELSGDALEKQAAWWRERLAGAPSILELPTDRPRPAEQSFIAGKAQALYSPQVLERLNALARAEGATLFMVLLAAFDVLLSRWSGQTDILVGSPSAGRSKKETESLVGFFANTVVLRADLSGDPTFRELLARVKQSALGAFAHQDVPFEKLVEDLRPERSRSHSPLFQVMFVLQNAVGETRPWDGVQVRTMGGATHRANFDLAISLGEGPRGLNAGLDYAADLFEAETAERLLAQLGVLLEAVAAAPESRLSRLPVLAAEAEAAVMAAAAGPVAEVEPLVHRLFEAQAARTPDGDAVVIRDESLSYAELNARANRVARRLRALGVGTDVRVGTCFDRSLDAIVAMLAVLKAGGAYVPLDPAAPEDRRAQVLDDAGIGIILTTDAVAGRMPAETHVIAIDTDASLAAEDASNLDIDIPGDSLANVIYTSGSTGRPKGVMVPHAGLANLALSYVPTHGLAPRHRLLALPPLTFDAFGGNLYPALVTGAALVMHPDPRELTGFKLLEFCQKYGVNVVDAPAALLKQFMDDLAVLGDNGVPGPLELIMTGGEAVDMERLRRWAATAGGRVQVITCYGPTETTVTATTQAAYGPTAPQGDPVNLPLGRPLTNVRVHVLDAHLRPQPVGVPGEVFIAGRGVTRGYQNRPGQTATVFLPDPFSATPGARMYRTGDRARLRPDGTLEFMGRLDFQVKVRGFRVEPGEIEAAMLAIPTVRDAAVVVREDRLVGYAVPAEGMTVDAAGLREALGSVLPAYMVPSAFVVMDAFPLTTNRKVDRAALPAPEADAAAEYVAPRTETEQALAALWAELLKLDRVGATDDFFELGGHSLLATRMVSRMREAFGVELPLRTFFETPTLCAVAAEVDALRGDTQNAAPAIVPVPRDGDLPLSFGQERMWFVQQMEGAQAAVFHMPFAYRLTGSVDVDALRRAMDALVRRHESLRTRFPQVDGLPVQRILPHTSFEMGMHDVSAMEDAARADAATSILRAHATAPFDLATGPLFRAALVKMAADDHLLLINLHHVIGDGWSIGVIWNELSALYAAFSRGEDSPLAEPALQYADFAAWQRGWLRGEALERQLGYWRQALAGAPPLLELPTDRPRPVVQRHRGGSRVVKLDAAAAERLEALGRRENATAFMVLLAAMDVVLARLSGQTDIVVGTPIAGRTRAETEGMIGLFLNSLALRTDLGGNPSFAEVLRRVRQATLDAYAHQDVPFERILEDIRPERSLAHSPVFQVMLNLANFGEGEQRLGDVAVKSAGGATGGGELASKFDLTLYAGKTADGGLSLNLVYDADLFDAPRVEAMLAQMVAVLDAAAADATRPAFGVPLVTPSSRAALPDPAKPIVAEPWAGAVHERVAMMAARTPDAVALYDASESWTYAELDAAAGRIAARLHAAGIGAGDVVAVWAHRSAPLVRALLGVWKSGAAFAVLDPAYPAARLAGYVRASRPAALLRIDAAGTLPREAAAALAETVTCTIVLGARTDAAIEQEPAVDQPPPGVFGRGASLGERRGRLSDIDGLADYAPLAGEAVDPDGLAYVAFTSGTTGTPKAVAGTHRPLAHFFGWYERTLGMAAGDRVALLAGLAHDPLLRDVFAALWAGASVVIPDPERIASPGWLAEWMGARGVTVAHLTPAMAQLITATAEGELPALRLACFGGDLLRADVVAQLRQTAPNVRPVNFYGATETPQAMGFYPVPADCGAGVQPVGRGIEGVDVLVLTPAGAPGGIGELGEIAIRTPYLADGYLNDVALTAERFTINPWTGDAADRIYRTGDLGRYRADGVVQIAGRADRQVKVRGFRVEPGEIESALRAHTAVRDAVVLARGEGEDRRLVAWLTGDEADVAGVRAHLRATLPEYLVPSAFVWLDAIPLTPNGKVDRAALPEPAMVSAGASAPLTATQEALAEIWAELLAAAPTRAEDDFFALGGHSLLATRLAARVRQVWSVDLPLRAVFEHPSLGQMAAEVDRRMGAGTAAELPPVVAVERTGAMPATFQQERMWFVDRMSGGGTAYLMPSAHRLRGELDADAMRRAFAALVERHETLRTTLPEADGRPVQVIHPAGTVDLPVYDLSEMAADQADRELARLTKENASAPMDLATGPLFRASLVRMAADEHVLLACVHHAVSDGWSNRMMMVELTALYGAFSRGAENPLAPLPVQYADFAAWQREHLGGRVLDEQMAWWRAHLAGAPAVLELPADYPRPAVQSYRGAAEGSTLPAELLERLRGIARAEGATLYMVLLAAYNVLLSRWSGQEDVVVGTPIAGRTRRETEGLLGLFINTLALRTDLSGAPDFRALLGRVREATLGGYAHQDLPFERLVDELKVARSTSHSPVYQALFALQNFGGAPDAQPGGLAVEPIGQGVSASKNELSLYAWEGEQGLACTLIYNPDLFAAGTMKRMLGHFRTLLEAIAADPSMPVADLPLLGQAERAQVVDGWNATAKPWPSDATLPMLFARQVARTPDAQAVVFRDDTLTYAQLDARANRLANHLRRMGAGPEARVGICLERSMETVVAMMAVLKTGAAYLPLDPAYPADRLAYMLEDSGAPVLVTQASLRGLLPADGVRIVSVDEDAEAIAAESADAVETAVCAANAAYVIYTSGSTGKPKGVQVTHGNAVSFFAGMDERVGGSMPGTWLAVTRISFDIHVLELLWTLARGFRVVLQPEMDQVRDGESLAEQIRLHSVTHLQCTPSLAGMLIAESGVEALRGLDRVLLGGEALPAELAAQITGVLPGGLVNMYGPTETTVWSATHAVTADDARGAVPIGRPIANTRVYVLDAAFRPQPVGVPGELYIAGAGVTRGYHNRPELTADRFLPEAFGNEPGARMYRTGDRARFRADGTLEFLGRADFQVKIRGFRIEPGEIESALVAHPSVREAAVVVREDAAGDRKLVGYVVAEAGVQVAEDELRAALRDRMPEYMVPSALVVMDAFPLTPNGKLDRRALPAPDFAAQAAEYRAPRTPAEVALAAIWAELLGVETVGLDDDFFTLGGHSLLVTRMVTRVREGMGVELPLRAVFEAPRLAGLAARVEATEGGDTLSAIPLADRGQPLPLSFSQHRLWLFDQVQPGSTAYNLGSTVVLRGALDVPALERAVGQIVRRHQALRTVFATVDGEAVQVIREAEPFQLFVDEVAESADVRAAIRRRVANEARTPFDLARGPLFRARLVRAAADQHVLLMTVHHAVSDGWSMGLLFGEMAALYAAYVRGEEPALADLPIQYADFAAWQRAHLGDRALAEQLAWWARHLDGAPAVLELPTDRPRPAVATNAGGRLNAQLGAELLEGVRALAQREGATVYMVLLALWNLVLARWSGRDDVVVGSPIAGRTQAQTERLIGYFANTLALRTDLGGDPTFRELLARVRAATLDAYARQDVPFERVVEELRPERIPGAAPLFQVMFVHQNATGAKPVLPGIEVLPWEAGDPPARFDLTFSATETQDGLGAMIDYATDLFDRETVARMMEHLRIAAEAAVARPDAKLSALPRMPRAELEQVVHAWNQTDDAADVEPVHHTFERQAALSPAADAVVFEGETISYGGLNARANRLASRLRALGVGVEERVGLCFARSIDSIVAVMGILKAGGAYVPLDPGLPRERMADVVDDSRIRVVVTTDANAALLPESILHVVRIDTDSFAAESAEDVRVQMPADALAYVIYTSGSTGKPKGVMVPHAGVTNLAHGFIRKHGFGPAHRILMLPPLSFDASVGDLFPALACGAALVMHPNPAELTGRELVRFCTATGTNVVDAPAALFKQWADELATVGSVDGPLEMIMFGGEAVDAERIRAWERLTEGRVQLVNHYGPTEATVCATAQMAYGPDAAAGEPVNLPIGRGIANVRVYVLDASLRPQPVGVPGDLYIGGAGVTRGYQNRPGQTADVFAPDAFSAIPGARMYRTGDRARWRADGTLDFLGRADFQVKIRGFRVEPGEVEAALLALPAVRDAAVVALKERGETRLVGYVVPSDADAATPASLRDALKRALPEYMVPGAFVVMEAFPLNTNGKVDRKALPAPSADADAAAYVAPRTATEEVLAAVWAELLGVERISADQDFFAAGGHSLLATRVASRVREIFGVDLPLRVFFDNATLAATAAAVDALRAGEGGAQVPPLVAVDRDGELPLSFAQERLWFIDQLQPGEAAYNMPVASRMRGAIDVAALERALSEVVRRHQVLRTVFRTGSEGPVQVILPAEAIRFDVVDLSMLDGDAAHAQAIRLAREEAVRPFDLAAGPLFRAGLIRLNADEHVLLMTLHHSVSDGWSMGVLFREIGALYQAFSAGQASPLAELPIQYADFAAWQRDWLRDEVLEAQVGYWKQQLGGAPAVLELPTDRPRPAVQTHRGARATVQLPRELLDRLTATARREGGTLYMAVLAAYSLLLSRYSGQDDVVVGSPIAGRTRAETEPLIGLFLNTLALRTDLSGDPTFSQLLGRVREATLGAYAHQDVPFEKLVDVLQVERSLSHSPVYQALFALQNFGGASIQPGGLKAEPLQGVDAIASQTDLALYASEGTDGLHCLFVYNPDLFDASTIERMGGHLATLLQAVAADPSRPISLLPVLTDGERAALDGWRAGPVFDTKPAVFPAQFAQAVRAMPGAVAIVHDGVSISYAQLDARANRLANHLRRMGVGAEVRVGLCLERTPQLIVSALAILKAGGAYVPVEPYFPAARIAAVMEDAGASVLITTSARAAEIPAIPGCTVLRMDDDAVRSAIAAEFAQPPAVRIDAESLAHVIYTSGSTGKPKGVMIRHGAVGAFVAWMREAFPLGEGDRVLGSTSIAFDVHAAELHTALAQGATLYLVDNALSLAEIPADAGIVQASMVPGAARELLAMGALPGSIRRLLLAGEALPADLARDLYHAGLPELHNVYGPTEDTTYATHSHVPAEAARVTIGRPFRGRRAYVLDGRGNPVPAGVIGGLYLAGAGVARGYLGRPDLTATAFLPDPWGAPGERMYATGDRARILPNGEVEYLGRADFQVKVRGFRIELGEVETAIRRHPAVHEAVVLLRDERLVAYLVPTVGMTVDTAAVKESLADVLPPYMVPAAWMVMDALPTTSSGKVDRKALPAPEVARGDEDAYVPPRDAIEIKLVSIWEEVLRTEHLGVTDNFFDRGGSSLLSVRLVNRVEKAFGHRVPLALLVSHGTVEAMADEVRANLGADADVSPLVPLRTGGSRAPLFCMHPAEGGAASYLNLVRHLDADQPVYGLEDAVVRGGVESIPLEQMAASFLAAIRQVQPEGPYHLLGWSFGGFAAYELAQQLRSMGEEVALLALVDCPAPRYMQRDEDEADLLCAMMRGLAAGSSVEIEVTPELLRAWPADELYDRAQAMMDALGIRGRGVEALRRTVGVSAARGRTLREYQARPYAGEMTLLRAQESVDAGVTDPSHPMHAMWVDRTMGWDALTVDEVQVLPIPGNHSTLIAEPHVQTLARVVEGCLATAETGVRGG